LEEERIVLIAADWDQLTLFLCREE